MMTYYFKRMAASCLWLLCTVFIMVSCSDSSYLNALPGNSIALVSVSPQLFNAGDGGGTQAAGKALAGMLGMDKAGDCGIDLGSKIYLFETADGNLGLLAKMDSKSSMDNCLDKMHAKGLCKKPQEQAGISYTLIKGSWLAGYNDDAMVVIGPIVASQQAGLCATIARYMKQDEGQSAIASPLFDRLEQLNAAVAMVAQADALPEKLTAPLTLGAPKGADPSQVLVAATMGNGGGGCLNIAGETFSLDANIDKALKQANKMFRPNKGTYANNAPANVTAAVFMNIEGAKLLDMMRADKAMQALLAGINTAVDMDNIIRSINGDIMITVPRTGNENLGITMVAQLAGHGFLEDVDYWKQSCPKGGKIVDCGKDAYRYDGGDMQFAFGVTDKDQFYCGTSQQEALAALKPAPQPLPAEARKAIKAGRMTMVYNLSSLDKATGNTVSNVLKPLFGNVTTVVYSIK